MYDLIIIGSGPAGLTSAIYAGRASLKTLVIEKEYEGTGQIAESGKVDNYPGLPGISGYELGKKFLEHARRFSVGFLTGEVVRIERDTIEKGKKEESTNACYRVLLEDGTEVRSVALIYAAGAFPRKAGIPGEEVYSGRGVSYCALCDGAFYRKKRVAVLGGGDTALDDALYLSDIAETVYLIHRRKEFRGAKATQKLLAKKANIIPILGNQAVEIKGDQKVKQVILADGQSIFVDGIFVAFGSVPQTELLHRLAKCDENGYLIAGESCEVIAIDGDESLPGLYAAGDVRRKKLRQVATAVADGANAVVSAADYIRDIK